MTEARNGLNDEGGCAVDWSWLEGERVRSITNGLDSLVVTFESGLVFTVRALLWQGKPFLAFDPHAAPARAPG
ncbi:MAG TPA: hypothetical protein VIU64_06660 [Polyangia bacterium]